MRAQREDTKTLVFLDGKGSIKKDELFQANLMRQEKELQIAKFGIIEQSF